MIGLYLWTRHYPVIKNLTAYWQRNPASKQGWEGGAATPRSCAPRTHHTLSVAQATLSGALFTPLKLPPECPVIPTAVQLPSRAQQFRHHAGGQGLLVRWNEREGMPGHLSVGDGGAWVSFLCFTTVHILICIPLGSLVQNRSLPFYNLIKNLLFGSIGFLASYGWTYFTIQSYKMSCHLPARLLSTLLEKVIFPRLKFTF